MRRQLSVDVAMIIACAMVAGPGGGTAAGQPCAGELATAVDVPANGMVTLNPGGGLDDPQVQAFVVFINGPDSEPATVTVCEQPNPQAGALGYVAFDTELLVEVTFLDEIPDNVDTYFLRVFMPFDEADVPTGIEFLGPAATELTYFNTSAWSLAASGNDVNSPGYAETVGDRYTEEGDTPPETFSDDLGDYGVYWKPAPPRKWLDHPGLDPFVPIPDPLGPWHELWPEFCTSWDVTDWIDNGSGVLDECDYLLLEDPAAPDPMWWHVENVTLTVMFDEVDPPYVPPVYMDWPGDLPPDPLDFDPLGPWHEVYPDFCTVWECIDWIDNGNGVLDFCDTLCFIDPVTGGIVCMHVAELATDIEVKEEDPFDPPRKWLDNPGLDPFQPIPDPLGPWHELWPEFCTSWDVTGWVDNGSGVLDVCDYLLLEDPAAPDPAWWHVEDVTLTVLFDEVDPPYAPPVYMDWPGPLPPDPFDFDPIGPWHEVFPEFCTVWECIDWIDNGNGFLDFCDTLCFIDPVTGLDVCMHVAELATDIEVVEANLGFVWANVDTAHEFAPGAPWCWSDFTGPAGVPDGNIDLWELLFMLDAVGTPCEDPPVACVGDIFVDGVVDLRDLATLLAFWGTGCYLPPDTAEIRHSIARVDNSGGDVEWGPGAAGDTHLTWDLQVAVEPGGIGNWWTTTEALAELQDDTYGALSFYQHPQDDPGASDYGAPPNIGTCFLNPALAFDSYYIEATDLDPCMQGSTGTGAFNETYWTEAPTHLWGAWIDRGIFPPPVGEEAFTIARYTILVDRNDLDCPDCNLDLDIIPSDTPSPDPSFGSIGVLTTHRHGLSNLIPFSFDVIDYCASDVDADRCVNTVDLLALLAVWGQGGTPADINRDGAVGTPDLLNLLARWGPCALYDVEVDVELAGVYVETERCLRLEHGCRTSDRVLSFVDHDGNPATPVRFVGTIAGIATGGSTPDDGTYLCFKDEQHTLWASANLLPTGDHYVLEQSLVLRAGDTDNDGDVDDDDLAWLQSQLGQPAVPGGCPWNPQLRDADFNGDGLVDEVDEALLLEQWMQSSSCAPPG